MEYKSQERMIGSLHRDSASFLWHLMLDLYGQRHAEAIASERSYRRGKALLLL